MSYQTYLEGRECSAHGYSFYALLQAAMRVADTDNSLKLQEAWPAEYKELTARYRSPGGYLPGEKPEDE